MKLTEKEEKIARLALDKAAQPGERQAAAAKLIESFCARGVTIDDIGNESVRVGYRDRVTTQTVYRDRSAAPPPARPKPEPPTPKLSLAELEKRFWSWTPPFKRKEQNAA